jgi:tetratricopeptide (TPR) repeat protein
VAYNNICCAYNEMKDWDHAIEAGKKAIEIDPSNQLAKNNFNWAKSRKQLNQ